MDVFADISRCRQIFFTHHLSVICGRKLDLIKSCEALLSIESFDAVWNDASKSQYWIRVATALMPLLEINCFKIPFTKLLKQILSNESLVGRNEFLENVWNSAEYISEHIGIKVIEEFTVKVPKYIELNIVKVFGTILQSDKRLSINDMCGVWSSRCNLLIKWCTESILIFSIVSRIMNEILIRIRNKRFMEGLLIIKSFIIILSKSCSKLGKNVIELYPQQYRSLIYLLNFGDLCNLGSVLGQSEYFKSNQGMYNSIMNEKCEIIQKVLEERPEVVITLLSHQLLDCN